MADFELPFPFGGLSDDKAVGGQPPGTTGDALNVRGIDPATGRTRGGQRAGLSSYTTTALGTSGEPVQDLAQTMRPVDHVQFATLASTDPGQAQAAASGSVGITTAALIQFQGMGGGDGDTITLNDGRTSVTFQFVLAGTATSDTTYTAVEGSPVMALHDVLENFGEAITESNVDIGWTIVLGSSPYRLDLTNQRAGSGELGNTTIDLVALTPSNYAIEDFTGGQGAASNTLRTEWEKRPPGATRTVASVRDASNNLWTLSSNKVAVRYNPHGEVLATLNVPVDSGWTMVEAIEEDASGNVYFAAHRSTSVFGDQEEGKIWRYKQVEAIEQGDLPEYEQEWEWDTSHGRILSFRENVGVLYVTFASLLVDSKTSQARIQGYAPTSSTVPIEAFSQDLPFRPYALEIVSDGSVAVTHPRNAAQGGHKTNQGVLASVDPPHSWSPWDLENYRERLHFWVRAEDALKTGDVAPDDGDEVVKVPDHRADPPEGYSAPHDTTDRPLTKNERNGPVYDANGFGQKPSLRFDASYTASTLAGECLVTANNSGTTAKTSTTDALADQLTPFPSWPDSRYATFFVIRLDSGDMDSSATNRVLCWQESTLSHSTSPPQSTSHSIITGTAGGSFHSGGTLGTPSGGEVWYLPGPYYDRTGTPTDGSVTGGDLSGASTAPNYNASAKTATNARVAIISIVKNQSAGAGGNVSVVRVNGRQVDCFQHEQDLCNDGRFVLGCRRQDDAENVAGDLFSSQHAPATNWEIPSFKGHVAEILTVLGDSSASNSPNDLQVSCPIAAGGQGGDENDGYPLSGSTPPVAAHEDPSFASEVERIEGYLAAKYGSGNALPRDPKDVDEARNGTGFYGRHPFAGPGWYPPGPNRENDDLHELNNHHGKVVLFSPGLDLLDSAWGPGIGLALGRDDDRHMITAGTAGIGGHDYALRMGDGGYFRRLGVNGGRFSDNRRAFGWVTLSDVPDDGQTVTIQDGTSTGVFEFNSGAATNILVDTNTTPTDYRSALRIVLENFVDAIEASALDVDVFFASPNISQTQSIFLVQQNVGYAGNTTIATSNTDGDIAVSGFTGGSDVVDDWVFEDDEQDTPLSTSYDTRDIPINCDEDGNFYYGNRSSAGSTDMVGRKGADGTAFLKHAFDVTEAPREVIPALDPPDYKEEALDAAEALYAITERSDSEADNTVYRFQTADVSELVDSGNYSTRESVYLGVADGSIVKFARGAGPESVSGGGSVFGATSPYVQHATLFGDVFFTDGIRAYVYKVDDDAVEKFVSTSAGAAPRRFRLITSWRGRLVVARVPGDDFNWYMSKQGDPYNWNVSPVVINAQQAIVGSGPTVDQGLGPGDAPDVINALIPWSDDLLIYGGDRTINRLTGDPMAGGQIDLVTEATGIAFGSPWTRSPSGVLYFFGSRGGVWAMSPAGQVERLTTHTIERRMRDLQLDAFKVRLVWNYEDEGLHVIPIAYNLQSESVSRSWFLDVKNGAWWEDEWADSSVMPTAVLLADGDDPRDRKVLFGCRDGVVRMWDQSSTTDDGYRIQSHVRIGPLAPESETSEMRFDRLTGIVAAEQGAVSYEVYTGEDPETLERVGSGNMLPGRNAPSSTRWAGPTAWVKLQSGSDQRWALESLSLKAYIAGRKRLK